MSITPVESDPPVLGDADPPDNPPDGDPPDPAPDEPGDPADPDDPDEGAGGNKRPAVDGDDELDRRCQAMPTPALATNNATKAAAAGTTFRQPEPPDEPDDPAGPYMGGGGGGNCDSEGHVMYSTSVGSVVVVVPRSGHGM